MLSYLRFRLLPDSRIVNEGNKDPQHCEAQQSSPLMPAPGKQRQVEPVSLRPAWSTQRILGQPGVCKENLSQNKQQTYKITYLLSFFKKNSCCITQKDLAFSPFLPLLSECQNYIRVLLCLDQFYILITRYDGFVCVAEIFGFLLSHTVCTWGKPKTNDATHSWLAGLTQDFFFSGF